MVVTSNGRVLFWESSIQQSKALDSRAYFQLEHTIHAASIHDLKQMKVSFEHKNQGCYYFCTRFQAFVELTFYSFNHTDSQNSHFLRTQSSNSYLHMLKTNLLGYVEHNVRQEQKPLIIGIMSDQYDKAKTPYEHENSQQHIESILSMCDVLLKQLSIIKDTFMKSSAYVPINIHNLHLTTLDNDEIDAYRSVGAGITN